MTLVGLLPPICDNGNMLVDGGYSECLIVLLKQVLTAFTVDNLPVCLLSDFA